MSAVPGVSLHNSPVMVQGTYVFYLELVTDMLHLFVYLVFFVIVFANYGLPLHLVWPPGCASVAGAPACRRVVSLPLHSWV